MGALFLLWSAAFLLLGVIAMVVFVTKQLRLRGFGNSNLAPKAAPWLYAAISLFALGIVGGVVLAVVT